ncbi:MULTISPECIES: TetR/AcrR family transcriptional regulator [Mycobacteriaceae]|uniref:TetR/AcrR family transcriptional regulator n=1 Tax=Mycobacteriaceae TaxID=1762 RepID=UPI0008010D55|nr:MULTISPECIES: TetR family transcriptional regulator [Mycobacteriaceae]MCK0173337.1 TetR family transcriptional regulator [Mycolicibacterium sp. F2034L]OBB59330.1 TetR family transcriptional regulator [Mycobacterium sp. 852013-51886_SCH5428379]
MEKARSRNAPQTRADILAAARRRFATDGYPGTTMRAVAADVGVDPALIIRYFGSKQELFAEAAEFTIDLPDLTALAPGEVADALLSRFFAVWEQDTTFVALLRAAMTSETAADALRRVFATQVGPTLAAVAPDRPAQRAGLLGAFVIGLATTRYVLANPAVANLTHDELIRWSRPVIQQLLLGPYAD